MPKAGGKRQAIEMHITLVYLSDSVTLQGRLRFTLSNKYKQIDHINNCFDKPLVISLPRG
ncbi:hypothetical protein FHW88_002994 [Mucilaginibacter sp. SG538B]|nr:hypothetical protein [Mucilaginibacter sp. SG538B]